MATAKGGEEDFHGVITKVNNTQFSAPKMRIKWGNGDRDMWFEVGDESARAEGKKTRGE
jgi:hypothetical protein